jgi:hypothetical protein
MARKPYASDQSIHSMTTRQLRQYIADQADEAQKRLSTSDLDHATRAYRTAAAEISLDGKKVMRSTSYMTKAEMRERAYALRDFNSLDDSSGYSKSVDWKENRKRYQTFVKNRLQDPRTPEDVKKYWSQFLTPKGNISKRGYAAYKQYIEFLKSVNEVQSEYGYREIQRFGIQAAPDPRRRQDISNIFNKIFVQSQGKGLTQAELIDKMHLAIKEYDAEQIRKANEIVERNKAIAASKKRKSKSIPKVNVKKTRSKSNIKAKQGRKMKEHGTVRRTGS